MIVSQTDSGLRYAVRRSGSAVGYCALSIKCGSACEMSPDGTWLYHGGTAHFTEHTLFKGTLHKSAKVINGYLDSLGGELNAYTAKEEIVLHATVLKEDLRKAADLLFELASCPAFPEDEIEREKGVVIDEINSYKDSPAEEIYDTFEEMLFEGNPLSGRVLGTVSSVKKINSDELKRFVAEKFIPCNMALTLVADIEEKQMARLAEQLCSKYFPSGSCLGGQDDGSTTAGSVAAIPCNHFEKTVKKRNHQVNCVIGGLAPSLREGRQRFATILLSNILGGPAANSVLNSILREENGLVYGVESSYQQFADAGVIAVCLGCEKGNLDKCLKIIDRELLKLQDAPLSPQKLKAAKKQLLGQLAIASDYGEAQCLSMGKSLLSFNRVSTDSEERERIESITAEELQKVARQLFCKDNLSTLIFT